MEDILLYFSYIYEGDFAKIYKAITSKEKCDYEVIKKIKSELKCKYTTIISDDYPQKFKLCSNPPFVIYYEGDLSLVDKKCLGVIGSRNNSDYGEKCTEFILKDVLKELVIVSGLARGIDGISHRVALENNGKTIGVIGNGFNEYYPKSNKLLQEMIKNNGLLISEYPPLVKPKKENFPLRNRLIAALSDGILVIEAKKKSGSMITVNEALNLGKDIMCVPSQIFKESGTNLLIKHGAYLVDSGKDVKEIMNL